nr:hypothetical protein [Bacteroidota bacterium]
MDKSFFDFVSDVKKQIKQAQYRALQKVNKEQYKDSKLILPPLVAEIPWTHNIIIIEKCKDLNLKTKIDETKSFNLSNLNNLNGRTEC